MKNLNNKVATITVALILFIVAILIACVAVDAATPREFEYQPKTPAKQAMYEQKEYEKCLAEKELAQAKLEDVANYATTETDVDLNEMKRKRNVDCLEIMKEEPAMPEVKSEVKERRYVAAPLYLIDKVAYGVAMAETKNCTLGYGKEYNNCFGIKNGNTAPCKNIGRNNMCIYDTPEESYAAFNKIWKKWYGGGLPTWNDAVKWTGNDRPQNWIDNVNHYYTKA